MSFKGKGLLKVACLDV